MTQADGSVSEAHAVTTLLQQGISIEDIGSCIMHMFNSSVLVASDGMLWTSSLRRQKSARESHHDPTVSIPGDCKACVFVQFDDLVAAPLPQGSSLHTSTAVTQSEAEQALVDAVQFVLEQAPTVCSDLLRLGSALRSNHGNFPRSLSGLMSQSILPKANPPTYVHDDTSLCPVCLEKPIAERNSCGHGLCAPCWTDFVASTIRNSSTPEVQKGNGDDGGSVVLDVKCPGDADAKCRCPVQFSLIRKALPQGIENLVRTVIRSMSRLFLSGAAAIAQCVCGAVVCSTVIDSEVECSCGHVQCIGDMKRGMRRENYIPHPLLSSDEEQNWQKMNTAGSEQRSMIMRYKNCPKCGTMTTKCGCQGKIQCAGMDKCPNEACDHMKCSKCGGDWCWICRRIGSTETRCSRPASERKDTKELLLRIGPEVQALEKSLKQVSSKSIFDDLKLKDSDTGVFSSKFNRSVLFISGCPVKSVQACKQVLGVMDTQAAVIETADLTAAPSSVWTEMEHNGRKFFYNSKTLARQWQRPPTEAVPLEQRKVEVLFFKDYLSGIHTLLYALA
jgi:hypothetical protein